MIYGNLVLLKTKAFRRYKASEHKKRSWKIFLTLDDFSADENVRNVKEIVFQNHCNSAREMEGELDRHPC